MRTSRRDGEAEVDERLEVVAAQLGADEDEKFFFGFDGVAEGAESVDVGGCLATPLHASPAR